MFEILKRMTNLQKMSVLFIALVVMYLVLRKVEGLGSEATIANKPNNDQDATELKQEDLPVNPRMYDRTTGIITDASEFVGLPSEIYPANGGKAITNYGTIDKLDDGYNGEMGLNYNMCSKSCCSPQYPTPFELEDDKFVEAMKDKFVPNNYACNNAWNNVGCVCMTKEQHNYLESRGGNSPKCSS